MDIRKQLSSQIEKLPDDVVEEIADFTLFVMARRQIRSANENWNDKDWQNFALGQFFREKLTA